MAAISGRRFGAAPRWPHTPGQVGSGSHHEIGAVEEHHLSSSGGPDQATVSSDRRWSRRRIALAGRFDWAHHLLSELAVRLEMTKVHLLPRQALAGRVQLDEDDADDWRFLRRPALLGFVALAGVALGASLTSSPFKLEMPG